MDQLMKWLLTTSDSSKFWRFVRQVVAQILAVVGASILEMDRPIACPRDATRDSVDRM